jgi:hypothetical protein
LIVAYLDDQPAILVQAADRPCEEPAIEFESVVSAEQGQVRFVVANLRGQTVTLATGNVRRVRHDDLDVILRRDVVREQERDALAHAMPDGVAPCHVQRGERGVAGDEAGIRQLGRERDDNAAAPGPDVDDDGRGGLGSDVERRLHHEFGVGPRRQHVARDFEVEAPEFPVADDL